MQILVNYLKRIHRLYYLPRSVHIPFYMARVLIEFLNIFTFYKFKSSRRKNTKLCIEAGEKGWELIEYKELLESAIDFLGHEKVRKVSISKNHSYIYQVASAIRTYRPTHYVYDSRTGDQRWLRGLLQSFQISILFQIYGIVPICVLTDLPVRNWRTQTAVVSAKRGLVITLMSPRDIMPIFPHRRIIGPLMMPFSISTLKIIKNLDRKCADRIKYKSLIFIGSLYEPRTTLLNKIKMSLERNEIILEMKGRELGSKKFADEDYWSVIASASLVITTADQIQSNITDWAWFPHLIYRYLEVPAAGAVLIAQDVPALRRYLIPNIHYISYESYEEAVEKITYYWHHSDELERISMAGKEKAWAIIESNLYWICIDTALQRFSLH